MKRNILSKIIVFLPLLFIVLIISLYFVCPVVNDFVAAGVVKDLKRNPLPENTIIVDEKSAAGKLCGCGNGMQYFGALLLKSDLSLEELKVYYSQFSDKEWDNIVEQQCGNRIEEVEHQDLDFEADIDGDDYYILYEWGSYHGLASEFDLRGH